MLLKYQMKQWMLICLLTTYLIWNKSDESYLDLLRKNIKCHNKSNIAEEWSISSSENDENEFESISGSLLPCELWNQEGIEIFCNPKEWNSDKNIVIPSGKEENEDLTFLETDSLVDVAPSRMSTYKGSNEMGKNATFVVKNGRYLPGDKWSWRLDMLLIQAHEQFPSNWQKIARLLGNKKEPKEWSERYEILSSLRVQGHFSKEEDEILKNAFQKYGKNWAIIAKKWFKGRTAKQIRDHYMNTINKNEHDSMFKPLAHSDTIQECLEFKCSLSPESKAREWVQINIGTLSQSQNKNNRIIHRLENQTIHRENVNRQKSNSSIFTDESLKEEMKGTDQSWYNRLGSKPINEFAVGSPQREITKLGSKEQYKEMMSIWSRENSGQIIHQIFGNQTDSNSVGVHMNTIGKDDSFVFISKQTFQESWNA